MKRIFRKIRFCLCVFAGFQSSAEAQVADLSGTWSSDRGALTLWPVADGYHGSYEADGGRLVLRPMPDSSFSGTWTQSTANRRCNNPSAVNGSTYWGKIRIAPPAQSDEFAIQWTNCDKTEPVYSWKVWSRKKELADHGSAAIHPFEGNWHATWEANEEPPTLISAMRQFEWDCLHEKDSWCQYRTQPNAPFVIYAAKTKGSSLGRDADIISITGDTLSIKWGYHFLGTWGGQSTVKLTGENFATGRWTYGKDTGSTTWKRAISKIRTVRDGSDRIGSSQSKPGGKPITLKTKYLQPSYSMRGNRDELALDLLGENMWGLHRYFLPRDSGLEISGHSYICADGSAFRSWSWNTACQNNGWVVGVRLHLVVWSRAMPGLKLLQFDGHSVPFMLEVNDWPVSPVKQSVVEDATAVRMDFMVRNGTSFQKADQVLSYGQPFFVELEFDRDAGADELKIPLSIGKQETVSVIVYRSDDGRLYRSKETVSTAE